MLKATFFGVLSFLTVIAIAEFYLGCMQRGETIDWKRQLSTAIGSSAC
jgi:hypothetical protein